MGTYSQILVALIKLRTTARVSQEELAKRLGRIREDGRGKQSTISEWETRANEMGFDELAAYADGLGWTLCAYLYEKASPGPEARFQKAVAGLAPDEVASLLEAIEAIIKAPPDARTLAVNLLKSAAAMPR